MKHGALALLIGVSSGSAGFVQAQPAHFTAASRAEDPLRRPLSLAFESYSFGLADLDDDGDDDLFFPHSLNRLDRAERTGEGFEWPRAYIEFETGNVNNTSYNGPTFLDVDGDGRLDLVHAGSFWPNANYLRQASTGLFERRVGSENPFAGMFPALSPLGVAAGDIDGDGLTDLVVGVETGYPATTRTAHLAFVEQTAPGTFTRRTGAEDPFSGLTFPEGFGPTPTVVDADADGDADLVVSCLRVPTSCDGRANRYYEQTAPGVFAERTGAANPFAEVAAMAYSDLAVWDGDGDGDLDVLQASGTNGNLTFYERTASGLVRQTSPYSLVAGFDFGSGTSSSDSDAHLTFGDTDGDGDDDLVVGQYGMLRYYRRTASADEPFERRETQLNPFHWVQGPGLLTPVLGDVDGDGDTDLVVGTNGGQRLRYVENVDVNLFVERTGSANPFPDISGISYPALGDVDGDGDLDLVAGDRTGDRASFRYLEQTASGVFAERTGASNPFDGLSARQCVDTAHQRPLDSRPVLGDLDGDGDIDLVSGRCFLQHIGDAFVPVWTETANPLSDLPFYDTGLGTRWNDYVDALSDVDGDGDLDAFVLLDVGSLSLAKVQTFFNSGLAVADEPDPEAPAGSLGPPQPNPASGLVRLTLTVDRAQQVRVALYDVLGREVAVLHDGPAGPLALALDVDGAALPAGVYVVRASGESFVGVRRVTVAR